MKGGAKVASAFLRPGTDLCVTHQMAALAALGFQDTLAARFARVWEGGPEEDPIEAAEIDRTFLRTFGQLTQEHRALWHALHQMHHGTPPADPLSWEAWGEITARSLRAALLN